VRRAVEEGLLRPKDVVQIGLRGQVYSKDDFEFGRKHRFRVMSSEEFHHGGIAAAKKLLMALKGKPVYVTLDIDIVDPAFAPGTGTPQVGGLTSAQIIDLVRALQGLQLVGCDLVEVSPPYDNGEITSLLAANLIYELLCVM
jgi:arginase family enzyme